MTLNTIGFSPLDGHRLAAQMLRELEEMGQAGDDICQCWLREEYRNGRPQNNVVGRYLSRIRKTGSEALELGFVEVLSDFIAATIAGAIPDADCYEA